MSDIRKNWEKDQKAGQLWNKLKQERRDLESLAMDRRAREMATTREVLVNEILDETRDKIKRDCDAERLNMETRRERERLQEEARKKRDDDYALAKRRQLLRETDPDLKDLNRKLQAQYINRTLEAQILEKQLTKIRTENREKVSTALLNEPLKPNDDKIEKAELIRQYQLRRDLQDQMIEKQMRKKQEYDAFLQERVKMDEVVKRIHEEDQALYDAKLANTQRLKEEMEAFEATQLIWRERHKARVFEEDQKLRALNDAAEREAQRRKDEKQRKLDEKDQLALRMACMKYETESRIAQQETLIGELDALRIKDQQSRERKEQFQASMEKRANLRATLLGQIAERKAALERDAALDAQLHQRLLEDMATDAMLERMTEEKQRQRNRQFRAETQVLVDEHRVKRAQEIVALIAEEKKIAANEAAENDFIEQERILMIKEHAAKLGSFFPKGVLKPSDLPLLGPDLVSHLGLDEPK